MMHQEYKKKARVRTRSARGSISDGNRATLPCLTGGRTDSMAYDTLEKLKLHGIDSAINWTPNKCDRFGKLTQLVPTSRPCVAP